MDIQLTLTVDEVNKILASLGKHPFIEIANLIGKIKTQGEAQLVAHNSTQEINTPTAE